MLIVFVQGSDINEVISVKFKKIYQRVGYWNQSRNMQKRTIR